MANIRGLVLGCIEASKQAGKYVRSCSKREETEASARNSSTPDLNAAGIRIYFAKEIEKKGTWMRKYVRD